MGTVQGSVRFPGHARNHPWMGSQVSVWQEGTIQCFSLHQQYQNIIECRGGKSRSEADRQV